MIPKPLLQGENNENLHLKLLISYLSVVSQLKSLKTITASNLTSLRKSCPCLHIHSHAARVSVNFPICMTDSTKGEGLQLEQMLLPVVCSLKSLPLSQGPLPARSPEVLNSYLHKASLISKRHKFLPWLGPIWNSSSFSHCFHLFSLWLSLATELSTTYNRNKLERQRSKWQYRVHKEFVDN